MDIRLSDDFEKKNYYELLGVARTATVDEIKDAYREIARIYHPDSNYYEDIVKYKLSDRDNEIFQRVTAAYHTLMKIEKRREYDKTLPKEVKEWSEPNGQMSQSIKAWNTPTTDASMKLLRAQPKARVRIKKPEPEVAASPSPQMLSPQTEANGRPLSVAAMSKMNNPVVETQADRLAKRKRLLIGGVIALSITILSALLLLIRR